MEIKTKFSIGDKVFLLTNCRVIETEITGVSHHNIKEMINPKHKDPEKARRIYTNVGYMTSSGLNSNNLSN